MSTPENPNDPGQPTGPSYPSYPSYPSAPDGDPGRPGAPAGPPPMGTPYGAPPAPPPSSAYAHWGQRVGAYLIDSVITVPFSVAGSILTDSNSDPSTTMVLIGVLCYLVSLAILIWNLIIRQGRTGWSIGKKVLGIRLLKEQTGLPLGPGMTFVRMIVHILDALPCYLGYLWPLWDAKRQTFADKIIGTVVVPQAEPPRSTN